MSIRRIVSHPAAIIVLLPLLVASPQLVGLLDPDPMLRVAYLALHVSHGLVNAGFARGWPTLDPNDGFTTQALGHLAAWDWVHGIVPWWNPYTGVGLPLAGEYQPAAFFPLTLLQLLPRAMALQHVALQIIAGLGSYYLLDALRVGRPAATAGGVLFAFNGAIAWFNHAPAFPVPFLPWMLFGIERIHQGGSWRWFALALALNLLAGFPETAYINGLLVLLWAGLRFVQAARRSRLRYASRVLLGGVIGVALSAPQLLAFFSFLPQAHLGGHTGGIFANAVMLPFAALPGLVAPYIFGPIEAYALQYPILESVWGLGGYVSLPLLAMALVGVIRRRASPLVWLLVAWTALTLARSFGVEPITQVLNAIPGITEIMFPRYATPSWIMAIVILAAFGLDGLARTDHSPRPAILITGAVAALALLGSVAWTAAIEMRLDTVPALRGWAVASLFWTAIITAGALVFAYRRAGSASAPRLAGALLIADAALMALLSSLSYPASGRLDMAAIRFLQGSLGSYRFYSLGPVQANYGAYFRIASINHNYLPIARRWVDYVAANLDRAADPIIFNGIFPRAAPGEPSQTEELRRNLASYEWVGVKYVVAPAGAMPFEAPTPPRVYGDRLLSIYELADPRPYFEIVLGDCTLSAAEERTQLTAECKVPGMLLRRELFFPGWSATVNGAAAAIRPYRDLFQVIDLPAGRSTIAFAYAPPHARWGWLAAGLGVLALFVPRRGAPIPR